MCFYRIVIWLTIILMPYIGLAGNQNQKDLDCISSLSLQEQRSLNRSLMQAVLEPDYRAVRKLVNDGAEPNAWAPLSDFKFDNKTKFVELNEELVLIDFDILMSSNRVVNVARNIRSEEILVTPLHLAVRMSYPHIVNLLLEDFEAIDTTAGVGLTAFSLLAYQAHINNGDMQLMVQSFMESHPTEMNIVMAFHNAVVVGNINMIKAMIKFAPNSEVIKKLRGINPPVDSWLSFRIKMLYLNISWHLPPINLTD